MKNWKIWSAFLAVFAAGIIVGVVGVGVVIQHHFRPPKDPSAFHEAMRGRIIEDIIETVQPDPAVLPAIKNSVDRTLSDLRSLREDVQPKIKGVLKRGKEELKQYLTPEQADRFEQMLKDRRHGKFGFLRLPPPPPPPMP